MSRPDQEPQGSSPIEFGQRKDLLTKALRLVSKYSPRLAMAILAAGTTGHLMFAPDQGQKEHQAIGVTTAYAGPSVDDTINPEVNYEFFPEVIGNLETDGVVIYNMGTVRGVIDNQEHPQRNWQAVVEVAKKYAPNEKFKFFYYTDPNQIPWPQEGEGRLYDYDPRQTLPVFPTVSPDLDPSTKYRLFITRDPADTWQYHMELPPIKDLNYRDMFNRHITSSILFFIWKAGGNPPGTADWTAIARQLYAGPPRTEDGELNYPFQVVYAETAGK